MDYRSYIHYDLESGRIVQIGQCRGVDIWYQMPQDPGLRFLETTGESVRLDTHYVLDGVALERPTLYGFDKTTIAADGVDVAVLRGLPDPCVVKVDGVENVVVGGVLEIASDMVARYAISINHWPYLPFSTEIVAQ